MGKDNQKTIVLDIDDWSVLRNRWDLLFSLKDIYPALKVSFFFIPYDYDMERRPDLRTLRSQKLKVLKENLGWIELIPHGLTHTLTQVGEFARADYETTEIALKAIDEAFTKDGLPYVKGFKAPQWLWNKAVVRCLDDNGWFGCVDRNQPDMDKTKRCYVYTDSIHEPFWERETDHYYLHSHIDSCDNDIDTNFLNLLKIPRDVEFKFVS